MRKQLVLAAAFLMPSLALADVDQQDSRGRMRSFRINGYELSGAEYLPFSQPALGLTLYLSLAVYPLLGWTMLRRTEQPARIAGTALLGSLVFFLITNFSSWLRQDLPYPMTAAGLMESYWMGLPFLRGTLMGDLTFTAVLFGLHAVLSRATAPADRLVRIPVEHASR